MSEPSDATHGARIAAPDWSGDIAHAVVILRRGGLVALPTETVYGLGADARNPAAVQKIFVAKGRPANHPLIVHVAGVPHAQRYAAVWPDAAQTLARTFWPGPLTLIVPKGHDIAPEATAGGPTVGLRMPNHPLALALLRAFDGPIAAPSANRWTRVSPTTAQHVRDELGNRVDLILDGGPCQVGIESTVLSLAGDRATLLRPGAISQTQIESVIGPVAVHTATANADQIAPSPGLHPEHYAPASPTYRVEFGQIEHIRQWCATHRSASAVLILLNELSISGSVHRLIRMPADPRQYAQAIYQTLRDADAQYPSAIWIEMPPADPAWTAIRDRITRAARAG